jgi:TRAP-type C4-dicarboxylate transport system substrate-binding protein
MLAAARETTSWHRQEGEKADRELVEQLKKKGMQVNAVDPAAFIEPMKPVWREFGDKIGQKLIDQAAATK